MAINTCIEKRILINSLISELIKRISRCMHISAISIFFLIIIFLQDVGAQDTWTKKPVTNHGKKWSIGYLEGAFEIHEAILGID